MEQSDAILTNRRRHVSEIEARRVKWWYKHFGMVGLPLLGWHRRDVIR